MKKSVIVTVLLFAFLTGCGANHTGKLDTTKLEKVEYEHISKEQEKRLAILYSAPSLKIGLNSLPYEMKMPDHFPIKVTRYGFSIRDIKHDGTHIKATFFTATNRQNDNKQFKIESSHPVIANKLKNVTEVNLDDHVKGEYKGNALYFKHDDVSYNIIYWNGDISKKQQQKALIKLANEMIGN